MSFAHFPFSSQFLVLLFFRKKKHLERENVEKRASQQKHEKAKRIQCSGRKKPKVGFGARGKSPDSLTVQASAKLFLVLGLLVVQVIGTFLAYVVARLLPSNANVAFVILMPKCPLSFDSFSLQH
jgi:hypothetical protein